MAGEITLSKVVQALDITTEQAELLQTALFEFRSYQREMADAFIKAAIRLKAIKKIVGDEYFNSNCQDILGISKRTANRYLDFLSTYNECFNGLPDNAYINISQGALQLLSPEQPEVIDEIKILGAKGEAIDAAMVKKLIQQHDDAMAQSAALAEANAKMAAQLKSTQEAHELAISRQETVVRDYSEIIRRDQEATNALLEEKKKVEEELRLAKANPEKIEVPTIPKEYTDLNDKLQSLHAEIEAKERAITEKKGEMALIEENLKVAKDQVEMRDGFQSLMTSINETVTSAFIKIPKSTLQAVSTDPKCKDAIRALHSELSIRLDFLSTFVQD